MLFYLIWLVFTAVLYKLFCLSSSNVLVFSQPYYINPTMVENFPGNLPEKVEAFYYLQQVTMFKTVFKGEVDVHKTIGPLVVRTITQKY